MDFVTHLPRTSQGHNAVWVIVDRLTKSAHFLAMQMTLTHGGTLQVVRTGDCPITWSVGVHSIGSGPQVYSSFLGEFPVSHEDTVDDDHSFSPSNRREIREDYPDVKGHAKGMHPGSQR